MSWPVEAIAEINVWSNFCCGRQLVATYFYVSQEEGRCRPRELRNIEWKWRGSPFCRGQCEPHWLWVLAAKTSLCSSLPSPNISSKKRLAYANNGLFTMWLISKAIRLHYYKSITYTSHACCQYIYFYSSMYEVGCNLLPIHVDIVYINV